MNIGDKWARIWGSEQPRETSPSSSSSPKFPLIPSKQVQAKQSLDATPILGEIPQLNPVSANDSSKRSMRSTPMGSPTKSLEPSISPIKQGSQALRSKPSISSLASARWTPKPVPPVTLENNAAPSRTVSANVSDAAKPEKAGASQEQVENTDNKPVENNNADDQSDVDKSSKRSRTWSFWRSDDTEVRKEVVADERVTNQILHFSPQKNPKRSTTTETSDSQSIIEAKNDISREAGTEDAVLYKPHHSAKEFNKINTHKNENIAQNIIVPDWDSCLPLLTHDLPGYEPLVNTVGNSSSFDLKGWFNYLSNFSLRFGFKGDEVVPNNALKELSKDSPNLDTPDLRSEKYRLYGKSLTRLPSLKRACLKTASLAINNDNLRKTKKQKTQLEEDLEDENLISITNESNGKLLINPEPYLPKPHTTVMEKLKSQIGAPNKIKRILVIGVHGFFPNKMIRPLIGNPTGTSSKFANEAEKAIIRYCVDNHMMSENDARDMSIRKIALEKEGKIFDRVNFFLEVMSKWEVELNEADCIFIAAHSQGCVVSIILLARLIKAGILKNPIHKKLGILAMAGVNNGPFYGVDKSLFMKAYSTFEHESLLELFELTKFQSPQAIAYKEAIKTIIAMNCKICFIGSIDDQLVPLYSALASHIYHPNIYRACYIDQSARAPQFVVKLVLLCLQLQNLGYFDNGVVKELSAVLAGPITGGGHSRIYNDGKVYDLGLKFLLDTSDVVHPVESKPIEDGAVLTSYLENQIHIKEYNVAKLGTNPFILPWCLRGLLFNIEKNWRLNIPSGEHPGSLSRTGSEEVTKLYELFDAWKADTKIYRDLKFRLNGIRQSKL